MITQHFPPTLPEDIIRPLCQPFKRHADNVLDLYAMTQNAIHPGKCVQCFYRLLQAAQPEQTQSLAPLRSWIEENIEVSIFAGDAPAGRFPVRLDQPDLEQFCDEAMRRVRLDVVAPEGPVELAFSFKASA